MFRAFFFVFLLIPLSVFGQRQTSSLHPQNVLMWERTSPTAQKLDGPVLYQIIFRSNATPGHVPQISSTFTLTDSPIAVGGGTVSIGGMSVNAGSGVISFSNSQTFPGFQVNGAVALAVNAQHPATGGGACGPGQFSKGLDANFNPVCGTLTPSSGSGFGNDLVLDLELNETQAPFADTSGFGNAANAPVGGIAAGVAGHSGKAVAFSGGYLLIGSGNNVPDSPTIWVEAWVKPNPTSSTETVLSKDGAYSLALGGGVNGIFTVNALNGTCAISIVGLPGDNAWHLLSGWYNGIHIYETVDGAVVQSSLTACAKGPIVASGGSSVCIGANCDGTQPFSGALDEVRVRTVAPFP